MVILNYCLLFYDSWSSRKTGNVRYFPLLEQIPFFPLFLLVPIPALSLFRSFDSNLSIPSLSLSLFFSFQNDLEQSERTIRSDSVRLFKRGMIGREQNDSAYSLPYLLPLVVLSRLVIDAVRFALSIHSLWSFFRFTLFTREGHRPKESTLCIPLSPSATVVRSMRSS